MNDNISTIRKDGRDGLIRACNSNNEEVFATKAVSGEIYYCPICKTLMHLSHSVTGEPFFACNPGHPHATEMCMSSTDRMKVFKKSPQREIAKFCQPDSEKPPKGPGGEGFPTGGDPGGANPGGGQTGGKNEFGEITSLSQIYSEGVHLFDPGMKINGFALSEYIISFKSFGMFFSSPDFQLGYRIVFARAHSYEKAKKTILFKIFPPKNEKERYPANEVLIRVTYRAHPEAFSDHLKKILEKTPDGSFHVKKGKDALIACTHWKKMGSNIYEAAYKGSKQIWFAPDKQRAEIPI